ncbi:neurotrypsin-like [Diadema antillarum]|uniref:neurotrypsin-like n=1 Tax=Diadema antillarum TaxID=105358 RepID=UPI003A851810
MAGTMSKAIVVLLVVVLFENAKADNTTRTVPEDVLSGSVRLVESKNDYEGIVQIFLNSTWGTVCADYLWDEVDASVVCQQLGYSAGAYRVARWWEYDHLDELGSPVHYSRVQCFGFETELSECRHEEEGYECEWEGPAAVECYHEGSLRLVGGQTIYEGRVEILHDNEWGSICYDDEWHYYEMSTVCRQLDFAGVNASEPISVAGLDTGPIHLTNVDCPWSYGTDLSECEHDDWGRGNCSNQEIVRISCYPFFVNKGTSLYLAAHTVFAILAASLLALIYM